MMTMSSPFSSIKGHWGAISKTNHAVLRYREPVYKTIRELVMSYFHEYFTNHNGKKTLRSYSMPVDLSRFDKKGWMTAEKTWNIFLITWLKFRISRYYLVLRLRCCVKQI